MKSWGLSASAIAALLALSATAFAQTSTQTTTAPVKAPPKATTASACKGLDQAACTGNTTCTWIAATKRKDGKDVKAYCRSKPKGAPKAAATTTPATTPPAKATTPTTTPPPKKQ